MIRPAYYVKVSTLCMLGNCPSFCCRLPTVFKIKKSIFVKRYFRNAISVSNGFDPKQNRRPIGSDLGPNDMQNVINRSQKSPLAIK